MELIGDGKRSRLRDGEGYLMLDDIYIWWIIWFSFMIFFKLYGQVGSRYIEVVEGGIYFGLGVRI